MKILATLLSAAVLSFSVAADAFSQSDDTGRALTNDTGRALVASDVLKLRADTERSGIVVTPRKQFLVPFAGVVRVRWQVKSDGASTATGIIMSQIGVCSNTNNTTTYQQGQCNLRVVAGDVIDAYAQSSMATSMAFIRNVRVFYNVVNNPGTGRTLVD